MSEGNYWAGGNRVSRRAVLRGAAWGGVGLAASALIGCSSKTDSKGAAPGANAPSGTTAAAAVQGKSGGRLARAVSNDPDTLDLHSSETSATMTPAAPLLFSTITCWPSRVDMPCARWRPNTSDGLPAGNGTMKVSGLLGKLACARALEGGVASGRAARPATAARRLMVIVSSGSFAEVCAVPVPPTRDDPAAAVCVQCA